MNPRSLRIMRMLVIVLLLLVAAVAGVLWLRRAPIVPTVSTTSADPEGRVARAIARTRPALAAACRGAGIAYPPRELFLRAFKREAIVEAWARAGGDTFSLIRTFPITYSSGRPGPKRIEGDRQVPEGFYRIDRFNPLSAYRLSLRIDYPNAADRLLSDRERPGFDIYIHGGDGSVGCLPLGDDGIDALYVLAHEAGNRDAIPMHIFPARMSGPEWADFVAPFRASDPALVAFWQQLAPGFEEFERTRRVPAIRVEPDGSYRVTR